MLIGKMLGSRVLVPNARPHALGANLALTFAADMDKLVDDVSVYLRLHLT
jgi:hypothetical protein